MQVQPQGTLRTWSGRVFKIPIRCRGYLEIEKSFVRADDMEANDMIILEHARGCTVKESRLDGMGRKGGIFATGSRMEAYRSGFFVICGAEERYLMHIFHRSRNVFSITVRGGVHCQSGVVEGCLFVNCRGKSGAAVTMLGKKGMINNCRFVRCISDISGGAVDKAVGSQLENCEFQDCTQ